MGCPLEARMGKQKEGQKYKRVRVNNHYCHYQCQGAHSVPYVLTFVR